MKAEFNLQRLLVVLFTLCIGGASVAHAARIDAVRGKRYKLTKQHGPWMIMVASFSAPPEEFREKDGLSPNEAADELVYELRRKGIPAYTFSQEDVYDQVETTNQVGRSQRRSFLAQQGSVVVLAGNYPANEDKVAQKTLEYVKKFRPKFLTQIDPKTARQMVGKNMPLVKLKSGGIFRRSAGRPNPLSGAFLTTNPLLTEQEIQQRKRDPLLLKLNAGNEFSLLENPGRYTLVVGSFFGKSSTQIGNGRLEAAEQAFRIEDDLDEAARRAWEMAKALRQGYFVIDKETKNPRRQPIEAYVWHDRHHSVVTVGAFTDLHDPNVRAKIEQMQKVFGAKTKTNPNTKQPFLAAELMTVPAIVPEGATPEKSWIFDPYPKLMKVPQLGR